MSDANGFAVEMDGITRRFGDFVAVDRVTLRISKGQLYGFLGLNGAGKTTTIPMLTTLLPPSAGTAKLWGHDVVKNPLGVRKLVGLVSDETSESQSTWTAREYLLYFARLRRILDPRDHVERLLDDVGLDAGFRGKLIGTTGIMPRLSTNCLVSSPS
jgi:ABC-type multidrug transport system ATPase subunit